MRSMISDRCLLALMGLLAVLGVFVEGAQAADANLNMVFTTTNAGGSYGNRHVHVVWIKDSSGNFVYTSGSTTTDNKRAVWANSRASSLKEWWNSNVSNRSADVVARTGATQTAYKTYNLNWNWKRKDGTTLPDGTYQIHFLCTNADSGTPNNKFTRTITKGSSSWSIGPVSEGGYNNVTLTFTPAGLGVVATAATNITFNSATLNGQVTGTDGENPQVYLYWGDNDGGTNPLNWDQTVDLGVKGPGGFSTVVSELTQGETYYYTCRVVTSGGDVWAPSTESFTANDINIMFAQGDTWKYFKGTSFPGLSWNDIGFNDTNWLSGPTGIGYGDGDDATVLSDMEDGYITVYMRKSIWVDDPASISNTTFTVDYDDGFVAFINGVEVARRGVEAGQNENTTATSHSASANGGLIEDIDITAYKTAMTSGENIFAIEVHNAGISSSDLTMIPEMIMAGGISEPTGRVQTDPETLNFGTVAIGSHRDLAFNIKNTGNDVLEVTSMQAVGLETDVYSVVSAPVLPLILQPAETESITIRFSPKSVQEYKYTQLAIGSNEPDKVAYVELEGTGGPAAALGTRQVGGIGGFAKAVAKYGDDILLAQGAMLTLLDVSNPALPSKLNQIRLDGVIEAVTVQGDVAYAALGNKGFTAVNLKDFMPLLGTATFETGGFASGIDSEGSTLCTADGIAGTHVYDISTPLEPVFKETIETTGAVISVDISNDLIYILDESEGLQVVDENTLSIQDPTAHWEFDETGGLIAPDASINGHSGDLMNMDNSDWVAGKTGNALDFDGVDDYVEVSSDVAANSTFTVSFWARVDGNSGTFRSAFCSRNTNLTGFVIYASNDNKWEFWSGGGSGSWQQMEGSAVQDGVWTHIAVSFEPTAGPDGNGVYTGIKRLYINGTEAAQASGSTYKANTVQPVNVGRVADAQAFYFKGLIDEVRIYDVALTADAINSIVNERDYEQIEFGTQIKAGGTTVYAVDSFGNLSVLDVADDPRLLSETIMQTGPAVEIDIQNQYAYVLGQAGLEVLDVSTLDNPTSVFVDPNTVGLDIVVDGLVAYLAAGSDGFKVLDISTPAAVSVLGTYSLMSASSGVASDSLGNVYVVGNQQNLADYDLSVPMAPTVNNTYDSLFHAEDIEIEGSHAFVAAGSGGLNIFDLLNPATAPATFATGGFATAVSVNDSTAMICDSNDVYVLDVSSPMSPSLIGSMSVLGWGSDVAVGSSIGYVAEGGMGISILNLSNAEFVSSYPVSGLAYGVAIDGDTLYVACGTEGVAVLDVSNSAAPSLVAEYDLPGMIVDVVIVGDKLCVADATYGVSVLDVSNPASATLYAKAATHSLAFHISTAGSRILVADKSGGLAVLGLTEWPKGLPGNISGDNQVDLDDLGILAGQWLISETGLEPLAGNIHYYDDVVNLKDLSVMAPHWLDVIYPPGLVGYWQFNETVGLTAADSTIYSHTGTLMNMDDSDWVAGKTGNALNFDGVDDYVEVTDYPGVTGSVSRTCAAWIKTTTGGDILGWGNNLGFGTKWRFRVVSTGHLAIQVQGYAQTTTATVNDDQWHHVAVVLPDVPTPLINDLQLYIDGNQITDITTSFGTEPINTGSDSTVKIGAQSYLGSAIDYFEGLIDEVRIYDRALTEQEIVELAQ